MIYDCIIIGGGVVGTSVADVLSRYELSVLLLEKEDDVAAFASRANSGIVHAGYDCEPDTLKARFNVRGNELMWTLARELRVPHLKCGSLVVAAAGQERGIEELKHKADLNGVKTEVLDREKTFEIEPRVSEGIALSLYAPEAGIISPYRLTIALADRAISNGAEVKTEACVESIKKEGGVFRLGTSKGEFSGRVVINCAGANCDGINGLAGAERFKVEYRRGDYFVLDNTEREHINTVIFPLPTAAGKGILVAPTADGNVLYGPTSVAEENISTATEAASLDEIRRSVPLTYSSPAFNKCIRVYAGVRTIVGHDFIVKESEKVDCFYMAAGICSPGLTSAPAIGEYLGELIIKKLNTTKKGFYIVEMPYKPRLSELSADELNELIKKDKRWGRIVCRCEKVTEAEVVEAIRSLLPALSVDAVKRRVRAGMGRCQGGFCSVRVMEILSRELDIPMTEIKKGRQGSEIAICGIKEADND